MFKLNSETMAAAIKTAKTVHPTVKIISASERIYSVTGRKGDIYRVTFAYPKPGLFLGECTCPATGMCYHLAAAAVANIAAQSMRKQYYRARMAAQAVPAPSTPPATLVLNTYAGRREHSVEIVGETPKKYRVRFTDNFPLPGRRWAEAGSVTLVPKSAVTRQPEASRQELEQEIAEKWQAKYGDRYPLSHSLKRQFNKWELSEIGIDYLREILRLWFPQAA